MSGGGARFERFVVRRYLRGSGRRTPFRRRLLTLVTRPWLLFSSKSGEGADELFAGYEYYNRVPGTNRGLLRNFRENPVPGFLKRWLKGTRAGSIELIRGFDQSSPISGFPYAMSGDYVELLLRDLMELRDPLYREVTHAASH